MSQYLVGSINWNAGSVSDEAEAVQEITVTGAALGDYCEVTSSLDVIDLELSAQVTAANTVTVSLSNLTSGSLDIGSPDIYVRVTSRSGMGQADV